MVKVTVLYGHPVDIEAFENFYAVTHLPIAAKMQVVKLELTKFLSAPDGGRPAYYRMAEAYFSGPSEMQETLGSPECQAVVKDFSNFATGGVTIIIGAVEK